MQARLENPASLLPDVMPAVNNLYKAAHATDLPPVVLELVHLRASQVNGCSVCVDLGVRGARKHGETDERLFAVAAWRDTDLFTDAERAALELSEYATRLSDRSDPVPDEIWDAAAEHFSEPQLAAIVLWIAVSNFFNRINVTTRQPAPQNW